MPCRDDRSLAEDAHQAEQALVAPLNAEIDQLKSQLADRDAMLCAVLTVFEEQRMAGYNYAELCSYINWQAAGIKEIDFDRWWVAHQERDRQRKKREAEQLVEQRRAAMARLTPKERKILGLEDV